jgi:hypothetical protein
MSFPYTRLVFFVSFLLAVGVLMFMHVRSVFWTPIGAVLIAIPLSLLLNVWSTRFKPAFFKKWKPRRRSFFEWLYERDRPPEMLDKKDD